MRYFTFLPLLFFLSLVSFQIVQVQKKGVSTWVGGGFGMFANLDRPELRKTVVYEFKSTKWKPLQLNPNQIEALGTYQHLMNPLILESVLSGNRFKIVTYVLEANESLSYRKIATYEF